MLPSADQLFKDADFIFQQDLAPAHTAKSTKSWLNDHGVGVLDWPANSPDLNSIENIWGIVKRTMRNKRPKNADKLKATVKETWASITFTFSRRFYPKQLTIAFRLYIFISMCVPWESNPQPFALLTQCSTTEPHRCT